MNGGGYHQVVPRGWWGEQQTWQVTKMPLTAQVAHGVGPWRGDEWTARLPRDKVFIVLAKRWRPAEAMNEFSKVDGVVLVPKAG